MNVVIARTGGELRPEENRGALEDLVGPAQLADLPFEQLHPLALLGRQPGPLAAIDLGLVDPLAQGLGADAELLGHPGHRAVPLTPLECGLRDEPDGPFPEFGWIPPLERAGRGAVFCHDFMILQATSLHRSQYGSELRVARERGIPIIPFGVMMASENRRGRESSKVAEEFKHRYGAVFTRDVDSLVQLKAGLEVGLARILHQRFASPLGFSLWTPDVYKQATQFLDGAAWRLGMSQETSTLVLGPHRDRRVHEQHFYDKVMGFIGDITSGRRQARFLHVFALAPTMAALRNESDKYPRATFAIAQLAKLAEEAEKNDAVRIVATAHSDLNASIVGDSSFLMSAVYGARYYAWVNEFGAGANELWDILQTLSSDGMALREALALF